MAAIYPPSTSERWSLRRANIAELVAGAAGIVIWLHLLDASVVHPQNDAALPEHIALAALAFVGPPIAFAIYRGSSRAWQAAIALTVGLVALSCGAVIHVTAIVKNDQWVRSDYTGVPMTGAGAVLLVLGLVLATLAIPRWRYRTLMIPGVILGVSFLAFPFAAAIFATHAPRRVIERADLGAAYADVAFETSDGLTLRGWYVPSRNGAAVAVVHGSGGSRMSSLDHARMLVRNGYGVLAFDVRGHGESDGATSAVGWGAYPDLAAAAAFLEARPEVLPGRLGVLGLSMGAEVAIESAAHDDSFAAVVADGPSGRTLSDARDSSPTLSMKLGDLPSLFAFELMVTALSGEHAPPGLTNLSPDVTEPVLYIASGDAAPERNLVTKIAERSGGEHELWVVDGAGHVEGLDRYPDDYERRVVGFFDRWLLGN